MKKAIITALTAVLLVACFVGIMVSADSLPFTNLFKEGTQGYTSDEGLILTSDFVSSEPVSVSAGQTIWFGPCQPAQYFQLVGQNASGSAVTDKIRGKELTVADTFGNNTVIYQYTVPSGVEKLVFSVPGSLKSVFTVSATEITSVNWVAYWSQQGVNTDEYVGQNSYYEVAAGTKLYFGAITEADALSSIIYDKSGSPAGTIDKADLRLVENFGGEFGIYCYTIPEDASISYVRINYNTDYDQYYTCIEVAPEETVSDETIVSSFIDKFGVPLPLESTVNALSGKTALFLGDSITYGARDRANIYGAGGWAGRIGYYTGMNVTNNGVSGACISTARRESNSEAHYIYNNLVKTQGTTYDYVIMHGLFNDASEGVAVGTMQGKANFDPAKADVTTYAGGLELLFYQARVQNPDAILGFIVNFHTERAVDQTPYVEMAIAICEDWGIPYLDLYNRSGFSVEFDDGLHPSSAGYDSMYTIVANWMAGLEDQSVSSTAKVMSYNVYYGEDTPSDVPSIANRQQKVASLIKAQSPDILMMQEVTSVFMGVAQDSGLGYSYYGYCHKCAFGLNNTSGGSTSCGHELAPIAWKTSKYSMEDSGHFWTAESGISSDYPRCINWVVLKEKSTGNEIVVMNYHADPNSESVRNQTAKLVMEKLNEICQAHGGIPAVIGGDWNMSVGSTAYETAVTEGLRDIRTTVNPKASGSFNNWTRTESGKYSMGDYLFMTEDVNASEYLVITGDLDEGRTDGEVVHISDHCPIVAEISY